MKRTVAFAKVNIKDHRGPLLNRKCSTTTLSLDRDWLVRDLLREGSGDYSMVCCAPMRPLVKHREFEVFTQEQADNANVFHIHGNSKSDPRRWRRNGKTRRWKRMPNRFEIPVKNGLYSYGVITEPDMHRADVHVAEDCWNESERY